MRLEELLAYAPFIRIQLTGPNSAIIYIEKSKEGLLRSALTKLLNRYPELYVAKLGYTPKDAVYFLSLVISYK